MGKKENLFFNLEFDALELQELTPAEDEETQKYPELPELPVAGSIRRMLRADQLDWLMSDLKAVGFEPSGDIGDDLKRLDPLDENAHDFTGKEFTGQVSIKEYQGKEQNEWRIYRGPRAASRKEIDDVLAQLLQEKRALDAVNDGPV